MGWEQGISLFCQDILHFIFNPKEIIHLVNFFKQDVLHNEYVWASTMKMFSFGVDLKVEKGFSSKGQGVSSKSFIYFFEDFINTN